MLFNTGKHFQVVMRSHSQDFYRKSNICWRLLEFLCFIFIKSDHADSHNYYYYIFCQDKRVKKLSINISVC